MLATTNQLNVLGARKSHISLCVLNKPMMVKKSSRMNVLNVRVREAFDERS